jgi:predicted transcriptional regulator
MNDGEWFNHDMKVVIRILDQFQNQLDMQIRWTRLQNGAGLNHEQMKRYIDYLSKKGHVKVTDLGHRHRVVEITQKGIDFLKYQK